MIVDENAVGAVGREDHASAAADQIEILVFVGDTDLNLHRDLLGEPELNVGQGGELDLHHDGLVEIFAEGRLEDRLRRHRDRRRWPGRRRRVLERGDCDLPRVVVPGDVDTALLDRVSPDRVRDFDLAVNRVHQRLLVGVDDGLDALHSLVRHSFGNNASRHWQDSNLRGGALRGGKLECLSDIAGNGKESI